jgi:predicted metal-dependent hydrolase
MPQKIIDIPNIGQVVMIKRRGVRSIRLTITPENTVRVTLPSWLPYKAAVSFVVSRQEWLTSHRREQKSFQQGDLIAKFHRLNFVVSTAVAGVRTRVGQTEVTITYNPKISVPSAVVQNAVKRAGLRAIKQEAEDLLPTRLRELSVSLDMPFHAVDFKRLKARWGSCSHQKDITLNIFLMTLPWRLIDYVLVHELVHTKVLHHGPKFWAEFERSMPGAKQRRKELKSYNPYF